MATATLTVRQTKLADLRENPANPRRINPDRLNALKRSLEADPDMLRARPLIALPDGTVICGNMRLRAATELGWKTIPTVTADLDPARIHLWTLRDNQEYGEWEDDNVADILAHLAADGVDLALTGFPEDEIDRLLTDLANNHSNGEDPDPGPGEPPTDPRSKPGDIYQLGPHRLMCGDSTNPEHVADLMDGTQAELLWTDPPYGVSYVGKTKDALTIANDDGNIRAFLTDAFAAVTPHLAESARFYIAAPPGPRETDFRLAIENAGWRLHQELVWVKNTMVLGHSDYHYRHESILYGYTPGRGRPGRGNHEGTRWYAGHDQTTVLEFDRPSRSEDHPTMKPVELVELALNNSTRPGDNVLDPFAGSGTTLVAAEQTGRVCYAMEIDPRYCDVIRDRYEALTGG